MKRFSRAFSKLALLGLIALTPMLANADYYADLVEADGDWQISNISEKKESNYLYNRFNLNSEYVTAHRRAHECWRGLLGLAGGAEWDRTRGRYCTPDSYAFEESNVRYAPAIFSPMVWGVSLILVPLHGVAALLGKDPNNISRFLLPLPVKLEYDSEVFQEALNEAYRQSGGENRYKSALTEVDSLFKQARENKIESIKPKSVDVDTIWYISQFSSQKSKVDQEIDPLLKGFNMQNRSGYATEISSIDGSLTFAYKQEAPKVAFKNLTYIPTYKSLSKALEKVLFPAKNIDELEQRLTNASSQLNKWIESNRVNKERYLQHKESVRSDNKELMNQSLETLKRFNYQLSISSNGTLERKLRNQGVQFKFEYPKSASGKVGALKLDGAKPKLTILSKNFENLYPQDDLVINNSDIRVSLNNGYITIKNKTKSYVTLDALSLYHNSDVLTLGGNNFENYHEVAPEAETRLSLSAFNLRSLSDDYYAMTKVKAKKIKVSFGLAGKYRVTGRSDRKNFYKKKDYRLDKLIARYRNEPIRL